MIQVTASTFIGDPDTLARTINVLGASMSQFVGANFMLLEKPVSTTELAAAIVATPAGQELIEAAVERAVDRALGKSLTHRNRKRNV